jgi:hypothetical protein
MHDTERTSDVVKSTRPTPPTLKERSAVQRSVDRLLDELAPERALRRGDRPAVPVEAHRTPSGCILQATNVALSVSWFADATEDATLGELQIVVWSGTVARRGVARPAQNAVVVSELALHPVLDAANASTWLATDGRTFDSEVLAAHCLALLETARV